MTVPASPAPTLMSRHRGNALGLTRHTDHWTVLRGLAPFVWPEGRPDLRLRVAFAFAVLVIAKLVTVATPVLFKTATDALTAAAPGAPAQAITPGAVALGATFLILAYGIGRVLMMGLSQVRDVLFVKVGQHAVRALNNRTFEHLHRLSLRFHLERHTGGLSRVIERGTRGIDLILRMGVMQLVPTVLELLLVCGICCSTTSTGSTW